MQNCILGLLAGCEALLQSVGCEVGPFTRGFISERWNHSWYSRGGGDWGGMEDYPNFLSIGKFVSYTVLSQASAYGRSQLKRQKLRVGGYTKNELKCFNYPHARAHPGCEVSCQGVPNRLASSLFPCFVEASPTEKAVSCYKADWLVASLPSFRSVRLLFAVREFRAAGKEHCEQGHRQVCANLWCLVLWCPNCIRTIAAMWAQWTYLRIHYARI